MLFQYAKKTNYGKVPDYVASRKADVAAAQREYDEWIRRREAADEIKCLSDDERKNIISGLKKNWEDLHHQYQVRKKVTTTESNFVQGLSVTTDTAPKKYRKERMEAEMKQLERDIEMVEKHRHIFIEN